MALVAAAGVGAAGGRAGLGVGAARANDADAATACRCADRARDVRARGPADDRRRRGEPGGRLDSAAGRDRRAGGLARPSHVRTRRLDWSRRVPRCAAALSVQAWFDARLGPAASLCSWRGFVRAMLATRRLIREAVPLRPEWLPIDLEALRRAVGLRTRRALGRQLRSRLARRRGPVRPAVVIPPDLNDSLTPKQLTWVLLHELAHVRRGDLWVVVVQRVVQAVFFFHPAVHLANWIIDELREYACDDAALAACKTSRRDCGEGFLAIVERSVERAPVAVAGARAVRSRGC